MQRKLNKGKLTLTVGGRKTMRYMYTVIEPNNGNQEKVLEVGKIFVLGKKAKKLE
jgi:hypothetical protein